MLLAGVIGALTLYLLWRLALYLREPPPTTAEYFDIARSVAFAFAALGVLPAGYIAYVRQRTHDWQLREDRREQDHRERVEATRVAELTAKIARDATDLHLANTRADQAAFRARYAESAAQLGHDKPAIRLAGVYAMAQLADDWADPAARQQCIDVLCAYLRMPFPTDVTGTPLPGEVQVRETVVRVITAHLRADTTTPWRDANFDFTGSEFAAGTYDFSQAQFTGGTVTFTGAKFTGGTVTFDDAGFTGGTVTFNRAEFTGGWVTFNRAEFTGGTVTFIGAKSTGGTVGFDGAEFTGGTVTFEEAEFAGGRRAFDRAKFSGGTVSFAWTKFTRGTVTFAWTKFTRGTVTFEWAEFTGGEVVFHEPEIDDGVVTFNNARPTGVVVTRNGTVSRGWPPPEPTPDPDPAPPGPGAG